MDGDVVLAVGGDAGHRRARGGRGGPTSSSRVVTVAASRPWAAARATRSVPWGVPKSCSKRSGRQGRRLGQEREDPAAVVVDHDDAQVDVAPGERRAAPPASWTNATSPTSAHRRDRRRAPRRAPSTPRRRCRWRRGWRAPGPPVRRTTRGRGSASTRRRRGRLAGGQVAGDGAGDVRLGQRRRGVEHVVDGGLGARGRRRTSRSATRPSRARTRRAASAGSASPSSAATDAVVGIDDARTADLHDGSARRGDPLR